MKTIAVHALLLAGLTACAGVLAGDRAQDPAPVQLRYDMTVDATGKASSLKPLDKMPADVDQFLQQRVRSFSFEPATVNGTAQPATTTLYLTLGRMDRPGGKSVYRINALSTGPKLVKGRYEGLYTGQPRDDGAGYFIISYNAKGRVVSAELDEAMSPKSGNHFRKWALALAKSFRIEPEVVGGIAVSGTAHVPIVYCAGGSCPELQALPSEQGSDLGGEMVAESVLKLKSILTDNSI